MAWGLLLNKPARGYTYDYKDIHDMGFLDDMFKMVQSGELEKKLGSAADTLDKVLDTAEKGLNKAENKVTGISQVAGSNVDKFENRVNKAGTAVDGIAKKLPGSSS